MMVYLFPSFILSEEDYKIYQISPGVSDIIKEIGYFLIQSTKPQTIGTALHDSPIGLAGYMIEKFQRFSDCKGNVENSFSKDVLLNNIMIYWTSGAIASSANFYFESIHSDNKILESAGQNYVTVPTAGIVFPKEVTPGLQAIAKYHYNIQRWTVISTGGHFPALEEPEILVQDVREFRKQLSSFSSQKPDL